MVIGAAVSANGWLSSSSRNEWYGDGNMPLAKERCKSKARRYRGNAFL